MLEVRDILQINVTILAGLLILFTLIDLSAEPTEENLDKVNIELQKIKAQESELMKFEDKENNLLQESVRLIDEKHQLSGDAAEMKNWAFLAKMDELNETRQKIKSINNELQVKPSLVDEQERLLQKIQKEKEDFWITPKNWAFYTGLTFSVSCLVAVFGAEAKSEKFKSAFKSWSILFMAGGFMFLIIIFWNIGIR